MSVLAPEFINSFFGIHIYQDQKDLHFNQNKGLYFTCGKLTVTNVILKQDIRQ